MVKAKKKGVLSFKEYISIVLKKINLSDLGLSIDHLVEVYDSVYAKRLQDFGILYFLKALMSPLVEGLIALDRIHYMREHGTIKDYQIIEIFDKSKSARNFLLYALK
jgi:hypothetical protein